MSNISLFKFEEREVRVVLIGGEPWFVAKDVLTAIGSTTTVTAVEITVVEGLGREFVSNQDLDSNGGVQDTLLLSEPALTFFVSRSRTELGKRMNKWIHVEVLPQIRKTGGYSSVQLDMSSLKSLMQEAIRGELAPIQQELTELRLLNHAVNQSNGIQKQVNAQACNDFSDYHLLTFSDVVKTFRPYFTKVPKIISRARHSVGKVFATEQERELGKISGKYIFSGWEIQTAINCLDRAAKEVFIENHDSTLPLVELIEKMDKENSK